MIRAAPILVTERLRLRPHRREDWLAMCALWQHPETHRFLGVLPQDDQAVWFRLLRYAGMWALLGFGFWVVEDKATGAFLGEAGLLDAERGLDGLKDMPEAGWACTPVATGQGIATEAMLAILSWADTHLDDARIGCIIAPANAPSLRVAHKLGFRQVDRATLGGEPVVLLHRSRGQAASESMSG
jgi:RimJ/RimL family protein N-acetyltransferase